MSNQILAHFSDIHFHNFAQYNINKIDRLEICGKALYRLMKLCNKNGIDTILFEGDWYEQPRAIPTKVVNYSIYLLKKLEELFPKIKIYAITGNHDYATKNLYEKPGISALKHLEDACENFQILDNTYIDFPNITTRIHGIPYYDYAEHFDKALDDCIKNVERGYHNLLMIHQNPYMNDIMPFEIRPDDPRLKNFDHVFCGHIHWHQRMNDLFTIVGPPLHKDADDVGKDMGYLFYDVHAKDYKRISNKGKFPEFIEGEEQNDGNYYLSKTKVDEEQFDGDAKMDDYGTHLKPEIIVENYWKEIKGEDKDLLKTGLKLLK